MDAQTKVTILGMAQRVRRILEKGCEKGVFQKDACYSRFPEGCDDAALLLAQYLLENGVKAVAIRGKYQRQEPAGEIVVHRWLMFDDCILDITGDRFKDDDELLRYDIEVYFGLSNDFYGKFKVGFKDDVRRFEGIDKLEDFDDRGKARLKALYSYVSGYAEAIEKAKNL